MAFKFERENNGSIVKEIEIYNEKWVIEEYDKFHFKHSDYLFIHLQNCRSV